MREAGRSAVPAWLCQLPLQQQSVVLLASRGPDGVGKNHPAKAVVRAYRGTVFCAAYYGRFLKFGERADTFMSLDRFADLALWEEDMAAYFNHVDELPHHYHLHLMHGAEILGYKHIDPGYRDRWNHFYLRACADLHLWPETAEELDARLSDWNHEHWDSESVTAPDTAGE